VVEKKIEQKRHHYLPRCYLKNFTFDSDKKFLCTYQYKGKIIKTSISDIAVKKNLYTFIDKRTKQKTTIIEKMFAEIENAACPVLRKVIKERDIKLNNNEKAFLSQFIALLTTRTPAFDLWQRNMEIEFMKKYVQKIAENHNALKQNFEKAGIKIKDNKNFEDMRKSILEFDKHFKAEIRGGKSYFFQRAIELACNHLAPIIFYKKWHLLINNTSRVFITSDNPVTLQRSKGLPWQFNSGFAGGVIILTLSPNICLLLRNSPLKEQIISVNRAQVEKINHSVMLFAEKYIYANLKSKNIKQAYDNIPENYFRKPIVKTFGPYIMFTSPPLDEEVIIE
jgi:hypothetical protein